MNGHLQTMTHKTRIHDSQKPLGITPGGGGGQWEASATPDPFT